MVKCKDRLGHGKDPEISDFNCLQKVFVWLLQSTGQYICYTKGCLRNSMTELADHHINMVC